MKKSNKTPKGYFPYSLLSVCGNKLMGGAKILSVGDVFPVLIGKGSKPQIWLMAIASPTDKKFISIVEASISQHSFVHVEEVGRQIVVKVQGATVLRVEQTGDDQALVSELNMRPLGLNIYGGNSKLEAGGVTFSNNSFSGGGALISFAS
ncbi:hypothetical protein [Pseudomonas simiae]|uniref:hypothetical protein n=1 Tax=Pseudomonas simiae TaxID=321846 RepID=UPI002095BB7C|nr:hypothetical protein [Pseudomonas simiae]